MDVSFQEYCEKLGHDFMKARKDCRMTQNDLADASGIAQADISRFENGKSNPVLSTLVRLAECLDTRLVISFVDPSDSNEAEDTYNEYPF